jgi:hypothetical protein
MREKVKIVSRFGTAIAGFALQGVIEQNQNGLENGLWVGMKENYPLDVISSFFITPLSLDLRILKDYAATSPG